MLTPSIVFYLKGIARLTRAFLPSKAPIINHYGIGMMSTWPFAWPILALSGICLRMGCHPVGILDNKDFYHYHTWLISSGASDARVVSTANGSPWWGVKGLRACLNGLSLASQERMATEHVWLHMWKKKSGMVVVEVGDITRCNDPINLLKIENHWRSESTSTCWREIKKMSQI